jgi:hypothetical protein
MVEKLRQVRSPTFALRVYAKWSPFGQSYKGLCRVVLGEAKCSASLWELFCVIIGALFCAFYLRAFAVSRASAREEF